MGVLLTVHLGDPTPTRASDGIFFAGEKFTCNLTFSNVISTASNYHVHNSSSPSPATRKASAQNLHRISEETRGDRTSITPTTASSGRTSSVSQADADLEDTFNETLADRDSSQSAEKPHGPDVRPESGSQKVASNGPQGADQQLPPESTSIRQFLRKSISLSSFRTAVGSTLGVFSAKEGAAPQHVHQIQLETARHIQPTNTPRALRTTGAPRRPLPPGLNTTLSSPPSSPAPLSPFSIQVQGPQSSKIPADTISDQGGSNLRASRGPRSAVVGTAHLDTFPTGPKVDTADMYSSLLRTVSSSWYGGGGSAPTPHGSKPESIIWAYAQMSGQFSVDPAFIKHNVFESLKSKVMYRPAGTTGGGIGGGGTLGIGVDKSAASDGATGNFNEKTAIYLLLDSLEFCHSHRNEEPTAL